MKTFFYWSIYWFCSFFLLWIFTLKLFVDNFLWKEMKRNCLFKNKSWLVLISDILQYLKCTWNYQKCDFMGSLRQKFSPNIFVWTVWAESVFALASMSMLLFFTGTRPAWWIYNCLQITKKLSKWFMVENTHYEPTSLMLMVRF